MHYAWGPYPTPKTFDPAAVPLTLADRMFSQVRASSIGKARIADQKAKEAAIAGYKAKVEAELKRVLHDFEALGPSASHPVTMAELAERLVNESAPYNLVLATGSFDVVPRIAAIRPDFRIVFVLSDDEAGFRALAARERMLATTFPSSGFTRTYTIREAAAVLIGNQTPSRVLVKLAPIADSRRGSTAQPTMPPAAPAQPTGPALRIISPPQGQRFLKRLRSSLRALRPAKPTERSFIPLVPEAIRSGSCKKENIARAPRRSRRRS
jgi:hypothetical protein